MTRSAIGEFPDDYDYTWNKLKKPNILDESQAQLIDAQRNRIYLEDHIVDQSQVRATLQTQEIYQFGDDLTDGDDFGLDE